MDREALVAELPLPLAGDDDLAVVAIAVAVEDAFDIVLNDDEITHARLGTSAGVLETLRRHLGES
ncbi:hypothetical protein [Pseudactinotalea terrae]|uniref:hypothetical protein n=1 Tax=Pseudactinotalea terrae TaxID=1743262 RepID=UPI0012E2D77F|nr:hypothetical protein [Pseudactinotalea terrae]